MTKLPLYLQGKTLSLWLWLLVGLCALGAGIWAALQLRQPPPPPVLSQHVTPLPAPRPLQPFELVDHQGKAFNLERLRGTWTFLFFGYTHCPDVCPTTLATLNTATRKFAELQGRVPASQVVFVSIDPERDQVEDLAKFVPYFNANFVGVTGSIAAIDALTKQLNIMYLKVDPQRLGDDPGAQAMSEAAGGYLVDHSAAVLLIDPQARFHALFSAPLEPQRLARDFQQLSLYYEALQ